MKINGAKKVHYEAGPDMTPLVDVVMVLLIFLMMVGKFGDSSRYLVSNAPITEGGGGKPLPPGFIPDEPIDIYVSNLNSDKSTFTAQVGRIYVAGDAAKLTTELKNLVESLKASGKTTDKMQVTIKPGRDVQYRHLVTVYEAALKAGLEKIGFGRTS